MICSECGKQIPTSVRSYWKRYRNGEPVYVCNDCAACMVDERTTNELVLVIGEENGNE